MNRRRYKDAQRHEAEEIAAIVERTLRLNAISTEGMAKLDAQKQLELAWPSLVGSPIRDHTRPLRFHAGTLTLQVDSPLWHQELKTFGYNALLETLQKHFPFVSEVRFRVVTPQ